MAANRTIPRAGVWTAHTFLEAHRTVHRELPLGARDLAQRLGQLGTPRRRQLPRIHPVVGRAPGPQAGRVMLVAQPEDDAERLAQRSRRLRLELAQLLGG